MDEKQCIFMVMAGILFNGHFLQGNCNTCEYNKLKCFRIKSTIILNVFYGLTLRQTESLSP